MDDLRTDVLIRQQNISYNVSEICEVAWYLEGVDTYLENCIIIFQIFVKGNLGKGCEYMEHPVALARNRIFLVMFSILGVPKALQLYFRNDRNLSADVSWLIFSIFMEFCIGAAGRTILAGMVIAHQTFGDMLHWDFHFHCVGLTNSSMRILTLFMFCFQT